MPWFDYECRMCDAIEGFDTDGVQSLEDWCPHCKEFSNFDRKWTAPHVGRGSSGEPPR